MLVEEIYEKVKRFLNKNKDEIETDSVCYVDNNYDVRRITIVILLVVIHDQIIQRRGEMKEEEMNKYYNDNCML